jgi:cholesterol transport system auxiliary component
MRPIQIALLAVLLAACSLLSPPQPQPTKELLSSLPHAIPHGRTHNLGLLVLPTDAATAYDTARMAYTERPFQLGYFRDHEWAEPPAQMIHKLLTETLVRTNSFHSVVSPPDIVQSGYALRTRLLEMVQDYTRSPPVLRLSLRVELLAPAGRSIATREITIAEPMRQATPYAGVVAANVAVANALQEVADFVLENTR